MIEHIVRTENCTHNFKETSNLDDIVIGGMEVHGQANTITEFVQSMRLEKEWIPFGYILRKIYRSKDSKNFTAYLYKIGDNF